MEAEVVYIKNNNYNYLKMLDFVEELIGCNGIYKKILKPGMNVLLKPNMLLPVNEKACVTTHHLLVSAVAEVVRKRGCQVFIGDSPGGNFFKSIDLLWKETGMYDSIRNICEQVIFERAPIYVSIENGIVCKEVLLSKYCLQADVIINLPKLKTHTFTLLSGGIKNLLGLVPGRMKGLYHKKYPDIFQFSDFLLDLAEFINPQLTILDGIWGIEGYGPGVSGTPVNLGILIASTNVLAVDIAMTQFVGFQPEDVPYIKKGIERGIFGIDDIKKVKWNKEIPSYFRRIKIEEKVERYFNIHNVNRGSNIKYPILDETKCILCNQCVINCPQQAIEIKEKKLEFRNICIGCMCCLEMCLQGAISVEVKM